MESTSKDRTLNHAIKKSKEQLSKNAFLQQLKNRKLTEVNEKKLMRAVTTNNVDMVEELLHSKLVGPNIADNLFRTPLHLAASRNYKEIVQILIKYGADPNQTDIIGNTALHLATCSNNLDIVTLLLDAGTDISSLDKHGRSPLKLALSKLRLLQDRHRKGCIESTQLRAQLQQIIELMISCLRRQMTTKNEDRTEINFDKLKISDTTDTQLDNQMSQILSTIQNFSIN